MKDHMRASKRAKVQQAHADSLKRAVMPTITSGLTTGPQLKYGPQTLTQQAHTRPLSWRPLIAQRPYSSDSQPPGPFEGQATISMPTVGANANSSFPQEVHTRPLRSCYPLMAQQRCVSDSQHSAPFEGLATINMPTTANASESSWHAVSERKLLDTSDVVMIFLAKRAGYAGFFGKRLAKKLAKEYGVTPKAVRDIWNLRTWKLVTEPFWSAADRETALLKTRCSTCCARGVVSVEAACEACRSKLSKATKSD